MECLKCGGSGMTLANKPCDCGVKANEVKTNSPLETYIPEIYRNQSDLVGTEEIVVGDTMGRSLQEILNVIVNSLPLHPSLFLDLSTSQTGAYEVYYAILEKIILKEGDLPQPTMDMFQVNQLNIPRLEKSERTVGEGASYSHNYIISDFTVSKYENLTKYVKLFKPKDISRMKMYPLNMYHLVIKSTGGL